MVTSVGRDLHCMSGRPSSRTAPVLFASNKSVAPIFQGMKPRKRTPLHFQALTFLDKSLNRTSADFPFAHIFGYHSSRRRKHMHVEGSYVERLWTPLHTWLERLLPGRCRIDKRNASSEHWYHRFRKEPSQQTLFRERLIVCAGGSGLRQRHESEVRRQLWENQRARSRGFRNLRREVVHNSGGVLRATPLSCCLCTQTVPFLSLEDSKPYPALLSMSVERVACSPRGKSCACRKLSQRGSDAAA